MEFLKKVGSTAESLLDQVDQKTAEISKDVRSGSRAARMTAERLEKRERINVTEGEVIDSDLAKQIKRLQADLDAAGEVLQKSQQLAAEREMKITAQLERERSDREKREEELMFRIRQLETGENRTRELEELVDKLQKEVDEAHGSRDQDTVELQAQAEAARADAEQARSALAAAIKAAEGRVDELERSNLALIKQLSGHKASGNETSFSSGSNPSLDEEKRKHAREMQDLEDRLQVANDKRSSVEMQLGAERARADRLEEEVRKASATVSELREEHAKHVMALETKAASLKRDADEARAEAEALRRSNMDNGRDALERRLESLSSHLELKQRQIDSLRSEKRALEQRLNESPTLPLPRGRLPVATSLVDPKSRFNRLKIDPQKHKTLARAIDALDGLMLSAASIMRTQPVVRLSFVAYILLLHIWVFHVINWTSTPSHSPVALSNNLRGGPKVD